MSQEVFYMTAEEAEENSETMLLTAGWYYYWFCFPGCLPDSEPIGPFETREAAVDDALQDGGME